MSQPVWQEDYDKDGLGDACDPCPFIFGSICGPQQPGLPAMPEQWTRVATTTKLSELPIYGSERLGLMRPNVLRDTVIVINPTPSIFTRRVDQKEYELKDHLGNVRVVVSDMKKRVGDLTATFTLRVKSVNNYYAFGMLEEGMSGSSEGYRYGFQGQEMDNEINGVGNLYTAEYWEYDSRLGRRWNIDPRTSPEGSSYRTFSNNPIIYIDPFGDKEYSSMEEYKKATGKEELGEGDWLTEDREKWTEKWIKANLYNLKNMRSSEYTDIEQRRDFYRWFYGYSVAQGFETRWALAASIVADGAAKIAHTDFGNIIGVTTSELQKALEVGNQLIFDNVLPKLSSLISISPLKGNAAVEWDAKTLSEEQWLVQPMYNLLSSDAFDLLHNLATKSGVAINLNLSITNNDVIDKSWTTDFQMKIGTVPAFPSKWSLKNPMSRWFYGMMVAQKFRPILLVPVYAVPKNINYLNG